ncbi:unnamed protein product [Paramecium pentaurelia]|uniref:Transmembrane protein n=1 Tax=Paramecium pentaurelia TaxID=43138 RepID=A0A8S1V9R6_9CILI|nr:unnamed protein product [Paramecium pentaurelia]
MKTQTNETISFNILNFPSSKEFLQGFMMNNNHICQKLNIPLLQKKKYLEKNQRVRFQLFSNPIEIESMQQRNQQTQRLKLQTSFQINEQMENNIQELISRDKDMQIKRRFTQSHQIKKPFEIQTLKILNTNRDRMQSMPTESFQFGFQILENQKNDTRRQKSLFVESNSKQNQIPKISLSNNNKKIRNQSIKGIFNQIIHQRETIDHAKIKMRLVVKKLRLKVIAILIMAVLKLSKKYKLVLLKRNQALLHFKKLKTLHLNHLNKYQQRIIKQQYQNFIEKLFSKIIKLLNSQNYIKDFSEIFNKKQELIVDFQKQRLCYFIKLLFQDLELITRKNFLPPCILHSLNLSLFYGKHTQTSQFVSNRTQFYSKTVHSLNQDQKVLIALEYLIFTLILPNLLEITNKQVYTDSDLQMNFQFYFIAIPVLLTVFFTNHFKKLQKIKNSNVKPIQLILNVQEEEGNSPMKTQLITSSKLETDEELIISGDFKFNFVYKIFYEKPKWKIQMSTLFSQIVKNIEALIDIQNAE